ncbi:MAG: hydantoinase/oxoprolinase family protein [Pirellulales bacterium]
MSWIGLDIGGANLKAADGERYACSVPFPLWQQPDQLTAAIEKLLAKVTTHLKVGPSNQQLALTMTGELADCFTSKADGVHAIVTATEQAAQGRPVCVYLTNGRFVTSEEAIAEPRLAAASNWHALAQVACRYCQGAFGLLLDIGSTTCDIIPLDVTAEGVQPSTLGHTDTERLVAGELVYTGVQRSGLHGVVHELPWQGGTCPTAQEHFATTADAYVLLDEIPEDPGNRHTADGRSQTKEFCHGRLARTLCADTSIFTRSDALQAATAVRNAQLEQLQVAVLHAISRFERLPAVIVISGEGEFLARHLIERLSWNVKTVSLAAQWGDMVSCCGPAHALAMLARERNLAMAETT